MREDIVTIEVQRPPGTVNPPNKVWGTNESGVAGWVDDKQGGPHTHEISDISGLDDALDGLDDALKTLAVYVEGAVWTVNGQAPDDEGNVNVDVSGFITVDDLEPYAKTEDLDKKSDKGHGHQLEDITGQEDLVRNEDLIGYAKEEHRHEFSSIDNVPEFLTQVDLEGYATNESLEAKADLEHSHTISQISGLQESLGGKEDKGHTHVEADITDLQDYALTSDLTGVVRDSDLTTRLADYAKTEDLDTKADKNHSHTMSDISGLGDWKNDVDTKLSSTKSVPGIVDLASLSPDIGDSVFVVELSKPVWRSDSGWVYADGTEVE